MQQRRTLRLRPMPVDEHDIPTKLVIDALREGHCIEAEYNKTNVVLAPHILYRKPSGNFVDAVVLERDGEPPRELKLGAFNLSGLKSVTASSRPLEPRIALDLGDLRYLGKTIATLKDATAG